jgi:hypothetical protein
VKDGELFEIEVIGCELWEKLRIAGDWERKILNANI